MLVDSRVVTIEDNVCASRVGVSFELDFGVYRNLEEESQLGHC